MPEVFEKLGIRFQYPENWALDERDALEGENSVAVYSPGGSFWSIVVYESELPPTDLVEAALTAMKEEYDELDAEEVRETVAGQKLVGYDLNFYCLDLTNTALIRGIRRDGATYLIYCQADDREFADLEPVFRAITTSLLRE